MSTKKPATMKCKQPIVTVNAHAAKYLLDTGGHRFLDIRSKDEFAEAHIKNALHVAYFVITPQGKMKNPRFIEEVSAVCSKNDHIVVGCQTGTGSLSAYIDLLNADFKGVKNLGGGFNAWVDNDFDVQTQGDESQRI